MTKRNGFQLETNKIPEGTYLSICPKLHNGAVVLDYLNRGESVTYREAHLSSELVGLLYDELDLAGRTVIEWEEEEEGAMKLRVDDRYRDAFHSFFKQHKLAWSNCKRILKAEAFAPDPDEPSVPRHLEFACHPDWQGSTDVDVLQRKEELKEHELPIPLDATEAHVELLRLWSSEDHCAARLNENDYPPGLWAHAFARLCNQIAVNLNGSTGQNVADIIHEMRTAFNQRLDVARESKEGTAQQKNVIELKRMFELKAHGRKGTGKVIPFSRKDAHTDAANNE